MAMIEIQVFSDSDSDNADYRCADLDFCRTEVGSVFHDGSSYNRYENISYLYDDISIFSSISEGSY